MTIAELISQYADRSGTRSRTVTLMQRIDKRYRPWCFMGGPLEGQEFDTYDEIVEAVEGLK